MSGGMPNDSSTRVNDILLESQKMIYAAPPSREKGKQTVRSPMLEKGKAAWQQAWPLKNLFTK